MKERIIICWTFFSFNITSSRLSLSLCLSFSHFLSSFFLSPFYLFLFFSLSHNFFLSSPLSISLSLRLSLSSCVGPWSTRPFFTRTVTARPCCGSHGISRIATISLYNERERSGEEERVERGGGGGEKEGFF